MADRRFILEVLAGLRRRQSNSLLDTVVFPPHDAGYPARHAVGVNPAADNLFDTTTVAGMGNALLENDTLVEAFCARLDGRDD